MKDFVIKFEPFVFKQTVFIRNTETGEVSAESVPQKELASYISLAENLHTVHFFGNKSYAEKIKNECLTKYNLKDSVQFIINK